MSPLRPAQSGFLVAAAVAVLALSGCNLAPKYARPSVPTPPNFKEEAATPAVAWTAARPRDGIPAGRWWGIYRDPRLSALEEQVEVSNQGILAAAANFRAARAAVTAARSAYFPTITTAPSASRVRSSQTWTSAPDGSAAGGSSIVNEYVLPVDATYTVDLWHRVGNTVAASSLNAQASAADLATALLSTQAELARDYFALQALDAERQLLDETVGSYRDALAATTALYRNGIYSEEDMARAKTQLDATVAQATDLAVSRAATEHAIAVLIGKPPADFSLSAMPLAARPPAVPAGLPSDLLERRPDIAAAERRVAAANAQIGAVRAAYFPSLVLGAEGGWESVHLSQWFSWPSRFWSIGPQLAGTLFDGGARRAQTEQARAEFDQTVANYRQTVLGAFQAVEDNLAALRILDSEAGQQQTAVDSSRRLLDLATTRYHTGIDSYLNVITAQAALLSNRELEVQIQLRQMTSSVSLVLALGGGWDAARLSQPRDPGSDSALAAGRR
jgi:NodT family efflux transporter outer membrane factor (OMF) lipoprotein